MADMAWLGVSVLILIFGGAFGFWLGRHTAPTTKQLREMREALAEKRSEISGYREEVNRHFQETAERVTAVTEAYRELYRHLADSSHRLAPGRAEQLLESTGEQKLLEDPATREAASPSATATDSQHSAPAPGPDGEPPVARDAGPATGTQSGPDDVAAPKEPPRHYPLPEGAVPTAAARADANTDTDTSGRHKDPASVPEDTDAEAGGAKTPARS